MADEVDQTNARIETETALVVAEICRCANCVPSGQPGECYYCGEWFARVVTVEDSATESPVEACGKCRDARHLP